MNHISTVLVSLSLLGLIACDVSNESLHGQSKTIVGATDADRAWENLMTSAPRQRQRDVSRSSFFSRQAELDRQKLRAEGIKFWDDFPDDNRRYSWLILTVALPPYYPASIEEWAKTESLIGPNTTPINDDARAGWEELYPDLRRQFWESSTVDDTQRRLLWANEIRAKLLSLRREREIGADLPEADVLLNEVEAFFHRFPEPENDTVDERTAFRWDRSTVLNLALGWPDVLDLSDKDVVAFADRLDQIDSTWMQAVADAIREAGRYPVSTSSQVESHSRLEEEFSSLDVSSWKDWRENRDVKLFGDAVMVETYSFPAFNQPTGGEATSIAAVEIDTAMRLYRELGLQYFDRMSHSDRMTWLTWTLKRQPLYRAGLLNTVSEWKSQRNTNSADLDWDARNSSDHQVERAIEALTNDPRTSERQHGRLRNNLVKLKFWTASDWWRHFEDRRRVDEVLEKIRDLDRLHGQSPQAAFWAQQLVQSGTRSYEWFGLTETDLNVYFEPFLDSGGLEMRALAASVLDRVDFEPGVQATTLQAPTLDGTSTVDTADMNGKILLIDHWDTNCAPCIAAFPGIHETYLKYQDQGFEVLSIAYDGDSQRKAVERIKDRMGLTWNTLNGEGLWPAVAAKYGYPGYPQYMLLDREGRWVAGTAEMGNGTNLEALLEDLLAEEKAGYYDRQPPIWTVTDEDTTIYLYGTLHSVKDHFDWLSEEAKALLASSAIVYTEVAKNTPMEIVTALRETYTRNPDGVSLDTLLSDDQLGAVRKAAEAAELDWSEFSQFKPGFAALELGNARRAQQGIERGESAEAGLLELIDNEQQELRYFASFERQMHYMAELPMAAQINFLMNALEEDDTDDFDRLFQAWFWGDNEAIEAEAITDERTAIPVVYEALMVGRNREWANTIDQILEDEQGNIFIAVGVGHLVGPDSVQSMLEDRGHEATRLH